MPIRNPVLCQLSDTQDRRNSAEAAPKSANGTRPVAYTACREEFTFRLERSHNVDGNVASHTRGLTGTIGLVSNGKRYGVGNLPHRSLRRPSLLKVQAVIGITVIAF